MPRSVGCWLLVMRVVAVGCMLVSAALGAVSTVAGWRMGGVLSLCSFTFLGAMVFLAGVVMGLRIWLQSDLDERRLSSEFEARDLQW